MYFPLPQYLRLLSVLGSGAVAVDLLFIAAPIDCGSSVFGSCFDMQYLVFFFSSFATFLMGR